MITLQMVRDRWNRDKVYTQPKFWDDAAEKFYGEAGTNVWVNPHINDLMHKQESGILHGWMDSLEGLEVLDLGCGAGRFAREFARRGARVSAIDFSPKSIEIARKLTDDSNISYTVGSIFDLEADNRFDVIVCSKVLSIACKDVAALRDGLGRIARALKPAGKLLSIELCHTTFVRRVLSLSYADYRKELALAGFTVVDTRVAVFIPARMALAFFEFPKWFTTAGYRVGEALVRLFPVTSDTKFTLAKKS